MKIILQHDRCVIAQGDSKDVGELLGENTIDSIVTDPPAGISFMQKGWDDDKGGRDQWIAWLRDIMKESMRVLKPGGHCLLWALPRTSHWTATALEDAGFEIRDVVTALNGQGFPKSLNVSKAIDARAGVEREPSGVEPRRPNPRAMTPLGDGERTCDASTRYDVPATAAAASWNGWGTALKPAAEFWILARKPLESTVAESVLTYGTGALNIDGCRIDSETRPNIEMDRRGGTGNTYQGGLDGSFHGSKAAGTTTTGRWPAHLVLVHADDCADDGCGEHCPARMLDEQSGTLKSGDLNGSMSRAGYSPGVTVGKPRVQITRDGAKGGASRFFYQAKAPRSEKDDGLDHLKASTGGEATGRKEGSAGTKNPRAGAGRTGGARNVHPTVKSVALMRWLVRLITPPGGTVLDLFAGSGTTGVAAMQEGMDFVGIEQGGPDDSYIPILLGRIEHALRNTTPSSDV